MIPIKTLIRLSRRVAEAWSTETFGPAAALQKRIVSLDANYRLVQRRWQKVRLAANHGLTLVLPQLRATLRVSLQALQDEVGTVKRLLSDAKESSPNSHFLFAELRQLQAEFRELIINWEEKFLAVRTEPVTLNKVALGPFEIRTLLGAPGARCG